MLAHAGALWPYTDARRRSAKTCGWRGSDPLAAMSEPSGRLQVTRVRSFAASASTRSRMRKSHLLALAVVQEFVADEQQRVARARFVFTPLQDTSTSRRDRDARRRSSTAASRSTRAVPSTSSTVSKTCGCSSGAGTLRTPRPASIVTSAGTPVTNIAGLGLQRRAAARAAFRA